MSKLMAKPRRVFYGWWIVLAGGSSQLIITAVSITGFGVFIEQFRQELGWSLQAIALGFSIRSLEQGVLSPFTGYFVDRFGPRKMAVLGVILVSVALLMFSQVQHLPVYFAASGLIAVGQSLGGGGAFSAAVTRWFEKKRGRATGWMASFNGVSWFGALVVGALVGAYGWREALVVLAGIVLVTGIPLAMVIRDRPEDMGYLPDGEKLPEATSGGTPGDEGTAGAGVRRALPGMEVAQAVRTPALYLLALANAVATLSHTPWQIFQIPHYQSIGFSVYKAGVLVAIFGVVQIPLRIVIGWLGDKVGRKTLYMLSFPIKGVGFFFFLLVTPDRLWALPLYYLTFGIGQAAWVICSQTMVADYFGAKRFGTIRGIMFSLQVPAAVASPLLAGWMYDRSGDYWNVFIAMGVICITGALWVFLIRRPLWREVEAAQAAPEAALTPLH